MNGSAPILTAVLLALTAFLLAVVWRYSARYMAGDPAHPRFNRWLGLTGACIFALVLAQNLLWFALAWCGISLSLHQLLKLYPNRPGAILAARKKFIISRVGDACLFAVLLLTHAAFGSFDFQTIFAAAPSPQPAAAWIAPLLAFAAILKSAQFPFHSWLPDTMETPTPVSALMHAGIINAGGILVIRLSPLIVHSELAMNMLTVTGAVTALFASTVMLTQASIKRCLAFSTVAQMGFMMLECGLGAFHLALLHLVAHSLYKAHAFLSTGGAVAAPPRAETEAPGWLTMAVPLAAAALWFAYFPPAQPLLTGIFAIAIAQLVWTTPTLPGLTLAAASTGAYVALEHGAGLLLPPLPTHSTWLAWPILAAFLLVAIVQSQLPRLTRRPLLQHLYVHARNGFYLNTLANRFAKSTLGSL